MIEIQDELAGFVEAICGEAGVEEAARAVGGCGAGGVAEKKKSLATAGSSSTGSRRNVFPCRVNSAAPGTG